MRQSYIVACIITLGTMCLVAAPSGAADINNQGNASTQPPVTLNHRCTTLDPTVINESDCYRLISDTHESMARIGRDGKPEPGIAESWEILPDKIIFHLDPTRRWSDGAPVVAEDFAMAWRKILKDGVDASSNPFVGQLSKIKGYKSCVKEAKGSECTSGIHVIDPQTLEINFDQLDRLLPLRTLNAPLAPLPSHFVAAHPDDWIYHPDRPFNGGYVIANIGELSDDKLVDTPIVLTPNPYHPEVSDKTIPKAVYDYNSKGYSATNIRELALSDNPTDIVIKIEDIPPQAQELLEEEGWKIIPSLVNETNFFLVNVDRVDRDVIDYLKLNFIWGHALRRLPDYAKRSRVERLYNVPDAPGPLVNNFSWKTCTDCAEKLAELQKKLGIDEGNRLKLTLATSPSYQIRNPESFKLLFKTIGIDLTIIQVSLNDLKADDADMIWMLWYVSLPDPSGFLLMVDWSPLPVLTAKQRPEFERLKNPTGKFQNPEERLEDLKNAEQYLVNESGVIPLFSPHSYIVYNRRLCGVVASSSELNPLIWLSYCEQ